jgi:hypothetical protein
LVFGDPFGMMWKEMDVALFEVLSGGFDGGTEEKKDKLLARMLVTRAQIRSQDRKRKSPTQS